MLEMLDYLRSQDFKTYIVASGETGFIGAFAKKVYSKRHMYFDDDT